MVTCPGDTFAARVAASLLTTLGLTDLIANDDAAFVRIAIELGRDAEARAALKARLADARERSPLFDVTRFADDFAATAGRMALAWREGRAFEGR